jgi:hypothetical protein
MTETEWLACTDPLFEICRCLSLVSARRRGNLAAGASDSLVNS